MTGILTALPFPKNHLGHYVVEVVGRALTGAQEIEQLEECGYEVEKSARRAFLSTGPHSYDAEHRLEEGKVYQVVLVPNLRYASYAQRSNENHLDWGMAQGYRQPLAGLQPRLHEAMQDLLLWVSGVNFIEGIGYYITTLHEPIKSNVSGKSSEGDILHSRFISPTLLLRSAEGRKSHSWHDNGMFAFLAAE